MATYTTSKKNHYNEGVSKAGMQSSNKTGLVLKISAVLFILLAIIVYKLGHYFKNEKLFVAESQIHNKVILAKTTVASQLAQFKNALSGYETELNESSINWVQLDPFFAIAKVEQIESSPFDKLKVNQMLVRSNTPAEQWNRAYLEKALSINLAKQKSPILAQLFQDKTGHKFLILRFKIYQNKELVVVGPANYFQKFFDLERGESSTALLATSENLLVAHSEGDYIATQTQETKLSKKKYLFEKAEIIGTNLIVMNYVLKSKISSGFVVPWSIVGVILGFGCILVAILFFSLDPMERKVERYKRQEREQVYKDTFKDLSELKGKTQSLTPSPPSATVWPPISVVQTQPVVEKKIAVEKQTEVGKQTNLSSNLPKNFFKIEQSEKEVTQETTVKSVDLPPAESKVEEVKVVTDQFLELSEDKIDISDIEKALALDDFDSEDNQQNSSNERLKEKLTPQKISISPTGPPIGKPLFSIQKKDFKVDEIKIHIRRPEKKVPTL